MPPATRNDARAPSSRPRRSSGADGARVTLPAATHRRRSWLLLAAAAWTAYVWLTRLGIVLDGGQSTGFRVVHGVLIVVSLAFAAALGVAGWRMRREARSSTDDRPGDHQQAGRPTGGAR